MIKKDIVIDINVDKTNYSECIVILFNKIKNILIDKIKLKNKQYNYTNINDFKENALKYLPIKMQSYAMWLHSLVMYPNDSEFEFKILLNIYNELTNNI